MYRHHSRLRFIPGSLAAVALACGLTGAALAQQQTQSIYLPDPTPRPPDLRREYSDDPVERAKQQQAAKLRNAMRMQQVVLAANELMLLGKQLKDEVGQHEKGVPMPSEISKAERIEKLAKAVKESMQSR